MTGDVDVLVVGGGIVGLATARALARGRPGLSVRVLEKESEVGRHQTGHNSGVLHSGLYYRPGSNKARLCVEGRREMLEFCDERGIPIRVTGKLVIATTSSEEERLDDLADRGRANGLAGLERLGPHGIAAVEPRATGRAALHVPQSGVVDYGVVAAALAADPDVEVVTGRQVTGIEAGPSVVGVRTDVDEHRARFVVNCAGLHSDRVAALAGIETGIRIVPFRGEYYALAAEVAEGIRSMLYPVPDPRFPFLGVHFTRTIDDVVEVGPNAVLALGREHYRGVAPDWGDAAETLRFAGLRRLAARYWTAGAAELARSRVRALYARSARRLVPEVSAGDLEPGGAGVRAQAVSVRGELLDDFVFMDGDRSLHVINAPSPAATASLAIGRVVARRCLAALDAD